MQGAGCFHVERRPDLAKEFAIMSSWLVSLRKGLVMAACLSLSLVGCGCRNSGLPGTATIELPDGTTVEVEEGAGAPSLANSQWQFFRTAGSAQGPAFVTIHFGPDGELESFEDSTISQGIFGDTILFDGGQHSTTQQGLEYAAATFGAENESGFTFEGQLSAFYAGIQAATATATATATYDAGDPDTVVGTFKFSITMLVSTPSIPTIPDDEFPFVGRRVTE